MKYPRKGRIFGRTIITTTNQPSAAPVVDRCFTFSEDGRKWEGVAILLKPWRKNKHGQRLSGPALVVGRLVTDDRETYRPGEDVGATIQAGPA